MKFKIDLHTHTKYSGDTDAEPEETVRHAIMAGLNGIAFTEHYSYEASGFVERLRKKYSDKILILRGVEFSSADGHCLVFGLNTDQLSLKNASIEKLVSTVDEHGGVTIPSHPFRGSNSIGDKVLELKGICALEGQNGYSHYSQNRKAIETAEALSLPYTGGSDAHAPHEAGACYTEFNTPVTDNNFIDLLRRGEYRGVDTRKVSKVWPF